MDILAPACRSPGWPPPHTSAGPTAGDAFFPTMLHALPVGVCWQRTDGTAPCWANEPFVRLTGLARDNIGSIGSFGAALQADDATVFSAGLAQVRTGQADEITLELRCVIAGQEAWRQATLQA